MKNGDFPLRFLYDQAGYRQRMGLKRPATAPLWRTGETKQFRSPRESLEPPELLNPLDDRSLRSYGYCEIDTRRRVDVGLSL